MSQYKSYFIDFLSLTFLASFRIGKLFQLNFLLESSVLLASLSSCMKSTNSMANQYFYVLVLSLYRLFLLVLFRKLSRLYHALDCAFLLFVCHFCGSLVLMLSISYAFWYSSLQIRVMDLSRSLAFLLLLELLYLLLSPLNQQFLPLFKYLMVGFDCDSSWKPVECLQCIELEL